MQEYYQLQQTLLLITLAITGIIFISVWIIYSLDIALNYLLGACTGMVYLRMLAKDVERLGRQKERLSKTRFALFIGLIVVATQWHNLQIVPIFLGFLTYKATLIVYMVQTFIPPDPQKVK
jgi:ATP synthase protein I